MKKILSLLLTFVTLMGAMSAFSMSASAASTTAFDTLTTAKYAKVYTLSSFGRTIPYTNKNLTTRGSITYGKSSTAYIDNRADELYLCDVGKNAKGVYWAKVSYPIGAKRAYAYVALSCITSNNGTHTKTTSTGKFYCSYRKGCSTSSSYYVAKGDTVYLLATSGSNCQILYPISGGKWRIGWCSKTNYNKYCVSKNSNTQGSTISNQINDLTYSVSGNILTIKGVQMYEYPLNSTYTSSQYANVNGKSIDMFGWQCCGYARYIQQKLYGSHYKNNPSRFIDLYKDISASSLTTDKLKTMITNASVGAHLRIGDNQGKPHSMIIISVSSNGFVISDANYDNRNTIRIKEYTWKSYLNSNYGSRNISYIEVYR